MEALDTDLGAGVKVTTAQLAPRDDPGPEGPQAFPLTIEPADGDLDLFCWAHERKACLAQQLLRSGAILFRGFGLSSSEDLARFGALVTKEWMPYRDRATKRSQVAGPVYTSTDTPAKFTIPPHNESSFTSCWPRHIFFLCLEAAPTGGRTPIADVRKVYEGIDPTVRERFEKEGVRYSRSFGPGPGMDWKEVFQVEDEAALAAYCSDSNIELEWLDDGRARTSQVRPATIQHPETAETVWFNHAYALNVNALDSILRETLLRQYSVASLPHNTYYGDGEPIPDAVIDHIRDAYSRETVATDWMPGDLLMLDNMLVAHGREPYRGERRILAAMADPVSWGDLKAGTCQ